MISLLLLASTALLCSAAELDIPDCPPLSSLEALSPDSETVPSCFCDASEARNLSAAEAERRRLVQIRCILLPYLSNLTDSIQAVNKADYIVDEITLSSFNFLPDIGLPANYFADLKVDKLRKLSIALCARDALIMDDAALAGLEKSLLELSVTSCYMPEIPAAFQNLTQLESLDISSSSADIIRTDSFLGLNNLLHLDVSKNQLAHIEPGVFVPLKKLQNLTLGPRNDFNISLYDELTALGPSLKRLDMRSLDLRRDEEGSEEIPDYAFSTLSGLEELIMHQNYIVKLYNNSLYGLDSLRSLDMRVNALFFVEDGSFRHTPNLRRLDLSGNYIEQVTNDTFAGLHRLEYLGLSHQEFTTLGSGVFADMEALTELNIGGNSRLIEMSPGTLDGLDSLHILNLTLAGIDKIPFKMLDSVPQLEKLDLFNASIAYVDVEDLKGTPRLRWLDLRRTYLQSIPPGALDDLAELEFIDLSGNAWICDDRMGLLINDVKLRYKVAAEAGRTFVMQSADNTRCYRPWRFNDRKIMDLDPEDFVFYDKALDTTTTKTTTTTATTASPKAASTTAKPKATTKKSSQDSGFQPRIYPDRARDDVVADAKRSSVGIIVGVIVAALVTILIVAVVFMTLRRKRAQRDLPKPAAQETHVNNGFNGSSTAVYNKDKPGGGVELNMTTHVTSNGDHKTPVIIEKADIS